MLKVASYHIIGLVTTQIQLAAAEFGRNLISNFLKPIEN